MIEVPALDTIDFEALVEEGRGLIPRYAPAWTDHNLHDPGITLLDLIAWIVDQQVYRIGFVGDAHLAAFAALLGVKPKQAVPARGLIWPRPGALAFAQSLAPESRIQPLGQPGLAFRAAAAIRLSGVAIARIEAGARRIRPDETGAILLDPATEAIEIRFDRPLTADGEPFALGLAYGAPLPDLGGRAPAMIDCRDGNGVWHREAPSWTGAAGGEAGALLFGVPAGQSEISALRLDLGAGLPRRLLPVRIALDAIPIVQVERLPSLEIGEGNGWPDLELDLGAGGAIPEPAEEFSRLEIRSVRGDEDPLLWEQVRDFSRSGPDDAHFIFDEARGTLVFGNGVNGRALPQAHQIAHGALDLTLGKSGNLAAGLRWQVAGVQVEGGDWFGTSRDPVAGGADAWSREDLLTELRARARLRQAMLTDEELAGAARALGGLGIERAEVLPRYLPALPAHKVPGARTLLLRPTRGVEASDAWLDAIETALTPRRVLGERLAVAAPESVAVDIAGELLVAAGSDQPRIAAEAEERLRQRLAAARRSDDQEIEPWPSGRPVTAAELETLVASVDGVRAVTSLRLGKAGESPDQISLALARTEVALAARIALAFRVEAAT